MKKLLCILALIITLPSFSQNAYDKYNGYYTTYSIDSAVQFVKMFTKVTKRYFTFSGTPAVNLSRELNIKLWSNYKLDADEIRDQRFYDFSEYDHGSKYIIMDVVYYPHTVGDNPDMEIKGVTKYFFDHVYGRFLDIFPIWKTYFNSQAEESKVLEDLGAYGMKGDQIEFTDHEGIFRRFSLKKSGYDTWVIRRGSEF